MIDKQSRSKIAQRRLIISAAEPLHFDKFNPRNIKLGNKCSLGCLGTYKLLRGYPPSPQENLHVECLNV